MGIIPLWHWTGHFGRIGQYIWLVGHNLGDNMQFIYGLLAGVVLTTFCMVLQAAAEMNESDMVSQPAAIVN